MIIWLIIFIIPFVIEIQDIESENTLITRSSSFQKYVDSSFFYSKNNCSIRRHKKNIMIYSADSDSLYQFVLNQYLNRLFSKEQNSSGLFS